MSTLLAILDRLDRGDCRRCGAPAEEWHDCWRVVFDRLRHAIGAVRKERP